MIVALPDHTHSFSCADPENPFRRGRGGVITTFYFSYQRISQRVQLVLEEGGPYQNFSGNI